jgi:hypothetical protein
MNEGNGFGSYNYAVISIIFLFTMSLLQILEGLWQNETHYIFLTALVSAKTHNMAQKRKPPKQRYGSSDYLEMTGDTV